MRKIASGFLGFTLLATGASVAFGHSNGHEARTVAQCQRLLVAEQPSCRQCVTRPLRHHYHPNYPAGSRCRPDNGRP